MEKKNKRYVKPISSDRIPAWYRNHLLLMACKQRIEQLEKELEVLTAIWNEAKKEY